MIRGFYTAKTALNAHQEHMNTIANNMANVNTVGFKPMRTAFTDLIYKNLNREEVENPIEIGHGVKINKNDVQMVSGMLQESGRVLDFAILQENGFFAVNNGMDQIYYTRAGNFYLGNDDDTYYLVDGNGYRVLDDTGEEIEVEFDDEGNMIFDPSVIGVYTFENRWGLSLVGENLFQETEMSGEAEAMDEGEARLRQGYLEGSAVEIAKEMADVIEASKAFSFASRMVQVADEVQQTVNALR